MARSFDSLRLRHQRNMDERLSADHRRMARAMALEIMRAAGPDGLIPNRLPVRESLRARMWERLLKPYYIGSDEPLRGADPQSPYAQLLVDGIEGAIRIQAERQAALVRRAVRDPLVVEWLTGSSGLLDASMDTGIVLSPSTAVMGGLRGSDGRIDVDAARAALVNSRGRYEAFHLFVDPNGYRLSDRIWNTGINVRARIDRLLTYEISQGTSATEIAKLLEPFLTPGASMGRTTKPYGREGSFSARRLARTEVTAASGRATVNAAAANPFVEKLQWRLSASHPRIDHCDDNARGGENGDGIYTIETLPPYPDHPHCMCSILPVPTGSTSDLVDQLRVDIRAARGSLIDAASGGNPARARALAGLLQPDRLTRALMEGTLDDTITAAAQLAQGA